MTTELVHTPVTLPALPTNDAELIVLSSRWLASLRSDNTRQAYGRDMAHFTAWCAERGGNPLDAERAAVDLYVLELEAQGLTPSTVARRLSALASFYRYAQDADALTVAPTDRVRRPRVSNESPRLGLDRDEARRFLAAADEAGPNEHALACLLMINGLRVSEALSLTVADLDTERGHRVARVVGKGGKHRVAPLAPRTVGAVEAAIGERATGHVIAGPEGAPLNRHQATRIVARIARRAGLDKRISPHSLRHTMVTLALDAGAPIHVVQDAAGHASPETTRRYDRARHALDGHATYTLAVHLADEAAA